MIPLFSNTTATVLRKSITVDSGVRFHIWPVSIALQVQLGENKRHYQFNAPTGTNIQPGDVIQGYNPLNSGGSINLLVQSVIARTGMPGHLEGLALATGPSATNS